MANIPKFEVPDALRQLAEQNVTQARTAYNQFMDMARQAQDMMTSSSGTATNSARTLNQRALKFAQDNMEAGFDAMEELAKAKTLQEYIEIQTRHTQKSMAAYAAQAEELGKLMQAATVEATKTTKG